MKYMTKEWYETMQKTSLHMLLKPSERAATFSEEYFQEVYANAEAEWVEFRTSVFKTKEEVEKENFMQTHLLGVYVLKSKLPDDILKQVADIRVFALHYATDEVIKSITEYCKENERAVDKAFSDYNDYFNREFKSSKPDFLENFHFHDCEIISCEEDGNDLLISLDNSGSVSNVDQIRLMDYQLIKKDGDLSGGVCKYEEIYKNCERYELHFLIMQDEMIDFIVTASDVKYRIN